MSNESTSTKIPEEALSAFLDGVMTELKAPADPATLAQVRTMFRKRIPLHLRSYAAALLILRAAGLSRQPAGKNAQPRSAAPSSPASVPPASMKRTEKPREARPIKHDMPNRNASMTPSMTPLFVSMGKRQRLHPQQLRDLISEKTGIKASELGRVHLFDNYSFIDIPENEAMRVIEAVNGAMLGGKVLEVKPARKRAANTGPSVQEQPDSMPNGSSHVPVSHVPTSSPTAFSTSAKATNGDNKN
ncbi:MAG TPA: DbpA RNA binding domain-containing protein [Spirochaetales bacterium]|nr:DbpA RNA binding domain-containing protein [Spirochaetales bacterium]